MDLEEPVSPTGQYLNSSALSISIIAVLEFEVPMDDLPVMKLIKEVFLPINPRFSSIMVVDENGEKQWRKVEVNLKDHVKVPIFPSGLPPESYDKYLEKYISDIGIKQLPQTQPLWEIHVVKYPTTTAAAVSIFKLHHSLGDGYSLMGALLSCFKRADNPSLPLTFPSVHLRANSEKGDHNNIFRSLPKIFSVLSKTLSDFWWSITKSTLIEDDQTPIRSGVDGVEFLPTTIATMTFSLGHIKQIKAKVGATVNDVITGVIFLGTRLYMEEMSPNSSSRRAQSTALVLLNTRELRSYKSVEDMVKPNTKTPWGNHFAFLHVPIPESTDAKSSNPLEFVVKAQQIINGKKASLAVHLTAQLLNILKKIKGSEAVGRFVHGTLKNTSMGMTNVIGPVEQMALVNHPVRGLYFFVVGTPLSLCVTIVSYMGQLRVSVGGEKGFIDVQKLKSCIEKAFDMVHEAAFS